jgi:hypothetical protein
MNLSFGEVDANDKNERYLYSFENYLINNNIELINRWFDESIIQQIQYLFLQLENELW